MKGVAAPASMLSALFFIRRLGIDQGETRGLKESNQRESASVGVAVRSEFLQQENFQSENSIENNRRKQCE